MIGSILRALYCYPISSIKLLMSRGRTLNPKPIISIRAHLSLLRMRGSPKIRDALLDGPNDKDCNILGSILGFLYFGKLPIIKIA